MDNDRNIENGLIDGIMYNSDEEKKLLHNEKREVKSKFEEMFKFPDLSE